MGVIAPPSDDRRTTPATERPQVDETVERTSDQSEPPDLRRTGLPERLTSLRKPCAAVTRLFCASHERAGFRGPGARGTCVLRLRAIYARPARTQRKISGSAEIFSCALARSRKLTLVLTRLPAEARVRRCFGRESTGGWSQTLPYQKSLSDSVHPAVSHMRSRALACALRPVEIRRRYRPSENGRRPL